MFEAIVMEYIADDGTRFSTEAACVAYENEKKRQLAKKEFKKVKTNPEASGYMNIDDGSIHYLDSDYDWYFPTNAQDIKTLREYYSDLTMDLDEDCIGEWICIEDDGCDARITTLAEGIEYAKKLLNMFGYDVVKMEEK